MSSEYPMNFNYPVNTYDTLKMVFPAVKVLADEENVLVRRANIGRRGWRLEGVWVFHGRDQGDHAEHDTEVYDGFRPLVLRSDHDMLNYQAWEYYPQGDRIIRVGINVFILGRSNQPQGFRPHWGIYLNWKTDG